MARKRNAWEIRPAKKPTTFLPDSLKAEVQAKANALIEDVPRPRVR